MNGVGDEAVVDENDKSFFVGDTLLEVFGFLRRVI